MMKNRFLSLLVLLLSICFGTAYAQEIIQFDKPEQKQRYLELLETTRCLVCQNQSLADSGAGLAGDLRIEIEQMVRADKTDEEIVDFLVTRYGDFVLYNPPFKASTFLLWSAPVLLLIVFVASMLFFFRTKRVEEKDVEVDSDQKLRAAELLNITDDKKTGE